MAAKDYPAPGGKAGGGGGKDRKQSFAKIRLGAAKDILVAETAEDLNDALYEFVKACKAEAAEEE